MRVFLCTAMWLLELVRIYASDIMVMSPQGKPRISLHSLTAQFGPALSDSGISGYVSHAVPATACTTLEAVPSTALGENRVDNFMEWWKPRIVLIQQGDCDFEQQVTNAQSAGYKAAIIFSSISDELVLMRSRKMMSNITIPAVFIGHMDGILLWEKYSSNTGYYMVISPEQAKMSGTLELTLILLPASIVIIPFIAAVVLTVVSGRCSMILTAVRHVKKQSKFVSQLPERKLTTKTIPDNSQSCSICLENYQIGERIRTIMPCEHEFHKQCVDSWLFRDHLVCPLCRREVSLKKPNEPITSVTTWYDGSGDSSTSTATATVTAIASADNLVANGYELVTGGRAISTNTAATVTPTATTSDGVPVINHHGHIFTIIPFRMPASLFRSSTSARQESIV